MSAPDAARVACRSRPAATSTSCVTGRRDCRPALRPRSVVSAPPASCTKRSAAARSQSWLLPPTKAASSAPCATRADAQRQRVDLGLVQLPATSIAAHAVRAWTCGPAMRAPVECAARRCGDRDRRCDVAPPPGAAKKNSSSPARRPRPTTGRPSSTSAALIDQSSRPAEIGARAVDRIDDPDSRSRRAARDRRRFPPRASRSRRRRCSRCAQQFVDGDVGFATPARSSPLVQLLDVGAEHASARARRPRARRAELSASAASFALSASVAGNGQSLDAHGRRIGAVAELEIVRRRQRAEDVEQMAGDGHLADRIGRARRSRSRSRRRRGCNRR